MNISRMDDNTIRCVLTSEDLEENGLNLDDFFHNSEHAREFLQTIVERAREEVGYDFEGGALAMQVMPLPQNGLLITFSEKTDSFFKGLSEHLKDLLFADGTQGQETDSGEAQQQRSGVLEGFLKSLLEGKLEKSVKNEEHTTGDQAVRKEKKKTEGTGQAEVSPMPEVLVYRFSHLDVIEKFAAIAQPGRFLKSSVYYLPERETWYLLISRGRMAEKLFQSFCAQALEYGSLVTDSTAWIEYLMEHGECVLEKDAMKRLKELL